MALLTDGQLLRSEVSGRTYRVSSGIIGKGGFGEVYRAENLELGGPLCIKATRNSLAWHGEAYFGRLLREERAVRRLLDAFPWVPEGGAERGVRYLLVLDWMAQGTVDDLLNGPGFHWPEKRVLRETRRLLDVLALLHARGICHGDITPRNVFIRRTQLVLGDLGMVTQSLKTQRVVLAGGAPPMFIPRWREIKTTPAGWTPSADVYQVALLALSLLSGLHIETEDIRAKQLRLAPISYQIKAWFTTAFGLGSGRYADADAALRFFQKATLRSSRSPSKLRGARVVFTGFLGSMTHAEAAQAARRAGASVGNRVGPNTTLVVRGRPNTQQVAAAYGIKLIDAEHRRREGQRIVTIGMAAFERLLRDHVA